MNGCGIGAGDDALDETATDGGNGVANNGGGNVDNDESDDGGGVGRVIAFDAGNCEALLVLRESNHFNRLLFCRSKMKTAKYVAP